MRGATRGGRSLGMPLHSLLMGSLIALGMAGCGDDGDTRTSAAVATSQSSTTQAPSPSSAPFLGASLTAATAGRPGVVVQTVEPTSKTRLKSGDVIVSLNGTPISSPRQLLREVGQTALGEQFRIRVIRGSKRFNLTEVQSPSAYLGADVQDNSGKPEGALVVSVAPKSPAAQTDLRRGDVITALDATSVRNVHDLLEAISTHGPGDEVTIAFVRGGERLSAQATLKDRPLPGP